MLYKETLDISADIFTIIGVIFAIFVYFRWKRNYKKQKAHEYAIDMLQQLHNLHGLIEALRAPKFHFPDTVRDQLKKEHIPKIENIISESVKIRCRLVTAKYILKNTKILDNFVELIIKKIILKITNAVYEFLMRDDLELKNTLLWKIVFPTECIRFKNPTEFKTSTLGTKEEVINDDFNQEIENAFNSLYDALSSELTITPKNRLLGRAIDLIKKRLDPQLCEKVPTP